MFDPLSSGGRKQAGFTPLGHLQVLPAEPRPSVLPDFGAARSGEPREGGSIKGAAGTLEGEDSQRDQSAARVEEAFRAGFEQGKAAAVTELQGLADGLAASVEEVARFRSGLLERYERELLDLAVRVARKVLQRELAEHPEHWLEMIREGVKKAVDRERIVIRVGSVLHHFLVAELPRLAGLLEGVKDIELVEDAALAETGCVIESRYGDLDLGIDSQLGAIRTALSGT